MEYKDKPIVPYREQPQQSLTISDSELSIRDACTDGTSYISVASGDDDLESFAATSFAGDADECGVKDPCAICFSNPRKEVKHATHFCSECGLLGHFLCEKCLSFHKKFTKHTEVKSLMVAARYKCREKADFAEEEHKNGTEKQNIDVQVTEKSKHTENVNPNGHQKEFEKECQTLRKLLNEKNTQIQELETCLQEAKTKLKAVQFKLQLTEDTK